MTTRIPAPAFALAAFAIAQVPLLLLAAALDWPRYAPQGDRGALADMVLQGSAISGPLTAQLPFLLVAFLATRRGAAGRAGTALSGLAGLLIAGNGAASLVNDDPVGTSEVVLALGSAGFTLAGLAVVGLAVRALVPRFALR